MSGNRELTTLIELLRYQAVERSTTSGYRFLLDGESDEEFLSFADLDRQVQRFASSLRRHTQPGDRALILCAPGLDYLVSLLGCNYAKVIAVPAYPPHLNRKNQRLAGIIRDCQPTVAIAADSLIERRARIVAKTEELSSLYWLSTEAAVNEPLDAGCLILPEADDVAFLQYTSGTTRAPRGVMLTHGNLVENTRRIATYFELCEDDAPFFWLPPYHDMGLIGGLLTVLHSGSSTTLISPASFVQKPLRWLQGITRCRARVSGGPNFAYDLCVRRISEADRQQLDLSSWELAFVGAEPVSPETLDRFAKAYEPCGFRREAFYPCYGLAEATLMVTGGQRLQPIKTLKVERNAFESDGRIVEAGPDDVAKVMVGCGEPIVDHDVRIVDPETSMPADDDRVGEIWVAGPSISQGYWCQETSAAKFNGQLPGQDASYLRTGDLGVLNNGELYVTGRMDDLLVVRGRNLFSRDIERVVNEAHPALQPAAGAAFAVETEDALQLVVVQELIRTYRGIDLEEVMASIRHAVADDFGINLEAIVLAKPGAVPKTPSGKIQRAQCQQRYIDKRLDIIAQWPVVETTPHKTEPQQTVATSPADTKDNTPVNTTSASREPSATTTATTAEVQAIRTWLVERIANHLKIPAEQIDTSQPFARYGLDSVTLVTFAGDLESRTNRPISPTWLYDEPTIEDFVRRVADGSQMDDKQAVEAEQTIPAYEPIAVIGMGCRFPSSNSPEEFWSLLRDGVNGVRPVPADRWSWLPQDISTHQAAFLDQIDQFDAEFFGIAPTEARWIDPQHRLLLEVAWESLENAAYPIGRLKGSDVGVFVGISNSEYAHVCRDSSEPIGPYFGSGNAVAMAAHRVSYHFDFCGPSMAIDTACSSSLVAIHTAAHSLHSHECSMALAGGVNLLIRPELSEGLSRAKMLSPRGACATFDAGADGYVRGEGCGLVVLKRLRDAVRDGDNVLAVIRASGMNQDGSTNGITAPNQRMQQRLIRQTLQRARCEPADITYVETHGTGTVLGDPIEVSALKATLNGGDRVLPPCALGAVKSNIGHLEAAAGVASFIKVVLSLQHGEIPGNLHYKQINPHLDLDGTRFTIPVQRQVWNAASPRIAALSGFGFGGTNMHLIVQEADSTGTADAAAVTERSSHLLTLSARSPAALRDLALTYKQQLIADPNAPLADICYSANSGRTPFRHRLAIAAAWPTDVCRAIDNFVDGRQGLPRAYTGKLGSGAAPRVAFLFSGQGSQYAGMGRQLYHTSPTFRHHFEQCDRIVHDKLGRSLVAMLFRDDNREDIHQTCYAQPALFALEYSLASMLQGWGIEPHRVMGHSLGEYVAACLADVFCLEDGLALVTERARLMQQAPGEGKMACVFATPEHVQRVAERYTGDLAIASLNGPENVVISGTPNAVKCAIAELEADGIQTKALEVSHAFHSPLMDPVLQEFERAAGSLTYRRPAIRLVSNLEHEDSVAWLPDAAHWTQHLRQPVRFAEGVSRLYESGTTHFVEIGPRPALLSMARASVSDDSLTWLATMRKGQDNWQTLLDTLAQLSIGGVNIDWDAFDADYDRRRVTVPNYPFQRQRHWIDEGPARPAQLPLPSAEHLGQQLQDTVRESKAQHQLDKYAAAEVNVDQLVASYAIEAVCKLGISWQAGQQIELATAADQLNIAPAHRRLFARVLNIMEEDGWLQKSADGWRIARRDEPRSSDALYSQLLERLPECSGELQLARRCGESLADVLCGKVTPLEVLFAEGNTRQLEAFYESSPLGRHHNGLVRDTLRAAVEAAPGRPLRILEVGGGTGGTTSHILPALDSDRIEYVFTDISPVFLQMASEKFRPYPFVTYQQLNLESDPATQGFEAGGFDIVIAANVIHATRDLEESVRHIRQLMAPGGLLVLLEGTRPQRLLDLIFGLTEGWWRFTDSVRRPNHPLISVNQWAQLLQQTGYVGSAVLAKDERDAETIGQAVILATASDAISRDVTRPQSTVPAAPLPVQPHATTAIHPVTAKHSAPESAAPESATPQNGSYQPPTTQPAINSSGSTRDTILAAPMAERRQLIEDDLRRRVGGVLGIDPAELDPELPVNNMGLDSLMAVQLRNGLESDLGIEVQVVAFLDGLTIEQLIATAEQEFCSDQQTTQTSVAIEDVPPGSSPAPADSTLTEYGNGAIPGGGRRQLPHPPNAEPDGSHGANSANGPNDIHKQRASDSHKLLGNGSHGTNGNYSHADATMEGIPFAADHVLEDESSVNKASDNKVSDSKADAGCRTTDGQNTARQETDAYEHTYPLSHGQRALFFLYRLAPQSPAYNFVFVGRYRGGLDKQALQRALQTLVDRHSVLRTIYQTSGDQILQHVCRDMAIEISEHDTAGHTWEDVQDEVRRDADRPFDLANGPVLRASLYRTAATDSAAQENEQEQLIVLIAHHIIADLWSMDVMNRELSQLYHAEATGQACPLAPMTSSYADYVQWEQELLASQRGETLWNYWSERLGGELPILQLPTDRPRPATQTYRGDAYNWTLDDNIAQGMRQLAQNEKVTMFMAMLTAFQTLLHRYTGQDDIIVGTTTATRHRPEWGALIGYLLNQVVLRGDLSGDPTFRTALARVRADVLGALEHNEYPFPLLVDRLQPKRDASRPPIFQVMMIWDKVLAVHNPEQGNQTGAEFEPVQLEQRGAPFDLTFIVFEVEGELTLSLRYNVDLFDRATIERMSRHLTTLLDTIIDDPNTTISELEILSGQERQRLLTDYNATASEVKDTLCAHELIQQHAQTQPNAIAVRYGKREWSYATLDAEADKLAAALRRRHVSTNTLVGLFMPRRPELIAAILGTWKAGAAYLPIDLNHPAKRIEFMLADARPAVILTHSSCADQLPTTTAQVLIVDKPDDLTSDSPSNGHFAPTRDANAESDDNKADRLAYVIYTSGSTGKPKGVMLRHGGLRNLIHAHRVLFDIQPGQRVLQFSNLSFDASVWEIALALGAGAELVIPEQQCSLTGSALLNELQQQEINYLTIPPSILATVEHESLPALHTIVSAGEACPTELAATWGAERRFFNAYGPTETTVCATAHRCLTGEDARNMGRPLPNMKVYVLDDHLQPVPTGVPGEICIAGSGLAVGYLNRPEMTAERFVPNPHCSEHGATLYRTGDLAYFHEDGTLEFLGRRDHQVKVRGFRIETGEIETTLLDHEDIAQTLVVAQREAVQSDSVDRLVAYYVAIDRRQPNVSQLRNYLKQQLPEYMVPAAFIRLDEFPLNVNGKIDRAALPTTDAARPAVETQYTPASTETEQTLVEIWKSVLKIDRVGIHDNFFDLGGASLQAVRVVDQAATQGLTLAPEVLFQYQTIAELAQIADGRLEGQTADTPNIPATPSANGSITAAVPITTNTAAESAPEKFSPCQVTTERQNVVIESLGVYLPERIVTSEEVVRGCRKPLDFPLERMTGIHTRRQVGPEEYSIDLARQAIQNCLDNSRYEAGHIELLIACNISKYDGPQQRISYEPSTAVLLKDQLGFANALAFDVSNACAGMFTAIEIADSFIQSGAVRRALVVSGEYITHLAQTAQFEIESFVDPQLACLTLGDSGVAAILEAAPTRATGFHDLELYTLGEYSTLCTAKAIHQPYGLAKMVVDPVRATAVTIGQAVAHARRVIQRNGWATDRLDHLIMHQTSETTLDGAVQELNDAFGSKVCNRSNTIYNVAERGNTATTTHLLALWDSICSGKINSGDDIVFAVSGSGQTVGTALYTLDDLPDRIRNGATNGAKHGVANGTTNGSHNGSGNGASNGTTHGIVTATPQPQTAGVKIAGVGTLPQGFADLDDTRSMLKAAGQACLDNAGCAANEIDLVLHAGVYRSEYLSEPALASILAGDLGINASIESLESNSGRSSLAFDLMNGSVGLLNAVCVATQMLESRNLNNALVIASEIDNNAGTDQPVDIEPSASALILSRATDGGEGDDRQSGQSEATGFGRFVFRSCPQHIERLTAHTAFSDNRLKLCYQRDEEIEGVYLREIPAVVDQLLQCEGLAMQDIRWIVAPQISQEFLAQLADSLDVSPAQLIDVTAGRKDLTTSSLPYALQALKERGELKPGDRCLLISAGSGVELGCTVYQS